MKMTKTYWMLALISLFSMTSFAVQANSIAHNLTAAAGYDVVSYHTGKKPLRGNGHHAAVHEGVTYIFANASNLETFNADPEKYVPAYGGYCAFGVSVGKKFVGDPEVWRVVDGRLYLNLDTAVQDIWFENVSGNIAAAEEQWAVIKDKSPAEL